MTEPQVLGNHAEVSSSRPGTGDAPVELTAEELEKMRERLDAGWLIRSLNSRMFPSRRLGKCGGPRGPVAMQRREDGRVQISGIATCGSVTGCVRCASIIRAARSSEIEYYAKAHLAAGKALVFVTLTLPHYSSDALAPLLEAITKAWQSMTSGSVWDRFRKRFNVIAQIRAEEVTIGETNGWHPHVHILFFLDSAHLDEEELDEFRRRVTARWGKFIDKHLGRKISLGYGVDARHVYGEAEGSTDGENVASYLMKIHFELARADLKTGRDPSKGMTPWQAAVDATQTGDKVMAARWAEFVEANHGRQVMHIPHKVLSGLYGKPGSADRTDEELAQDVVEVAEDVVVVAPDLWGHLRHRLTHKGGRSAVAAVIVELEDHGLEAARAAAERFLRRRIVIEERPDTCPLLRFEDDDSVNERLDVDRWALSFPAGHHKPAQR